MRSTFVIAAVIGALALPATASADLTVPGVTIPGTTLLHITTHGLDIGSPEPLPLPISVTARAASTGRLPLRWCGQSRTSDDTADELANGTHRYHAIYAIAADGPDRLSDQADSIQYSMVGASWLLENLYGRAIRFDMGTSCGRGYLDITTVRLPQTAAQIQSLSADPTLLLNTIVQDLDAAGFPTTSDGDTPEQAAQRTTDWVVFLEPPGPPGCGEGTEFQDTTRSPSNPNNYGGQVALLFTAFDGRFCGPDAVRHEIGHTLGALQSVAPHAFDGYHCNDNDNDTMCYGWAMKGLPGGTYFDYGNDDYWDPPNGSLPWWTVDLSDFLCPDAGCNVPPELASAAPPPAPAAAIPASSRASLRGQRVRVRMRSVLRKGLWQVRLSVRRGVGTAWVLVRCDDPEGWLLNRPAKLGERMRASGRCAVRPRAGAFRLS